MPEYNQLEQQNIHLIEKLYGAFAAKDFEGMAACYAPEAEFYDPVFETLRGFQISAMWRMLIEKSSSLEVKLVACTAKDNTVKAQWQAVYPFGAQNRLIHNTIDANFVIEKGAIVKHTDHFNLWRWVKMALGLKGLLLGFLPSVQREIRKQAQGSLQLFIKRRRLG